MRKDLAELCYDDLQTLPEDELQNKIGGGTLVEDVEARRKDIKKIQEC